ncbi:MAG: FAD-dependent oxidoreductase [Myxococcota bacterium]
MQRLGLTLDEMGFVALDPQRQTSRPGVYAAGDLSTPMQAAVSGAASGMFAAAMLNHALATG